MKRVLGIVTFAALAACSFGAGDAAGVPGSGTGTVRNFAVDNFTGIDLRGSDDVDVRVGSGFSIRAEGPSDELDTLKIEREGDTLKVGRRDRNGFSWGSHRKVKVFVTLPRLAAASVAGSGNLAVDRVEGGRFDADVAGSGSLDVRALSVDAAKLAIAGSGDLRAVGTARQLNIDIAGSGSVQAPGLKAQSAHVSIAGSGGVRVRVDGAAKVDLMGSGDVDLGPNARCTVSKMGSGRVRCA